MPTAVTFLSSRLLVLAGYSSVRKVAPKLRSLQTQWLRILEQSLCERGTPA